VFNVRVAYRISARLRRGDNVAVWQLAVAAGCQRSGMWPLAVSVAACGRQRSGLWPLAVSVAVCGRWLSA